jgi:hypothetical protein
VKILKTIGHKRALKRNKQEGEGTWNHASLISVDLTDVLPFFANRISFLGTPALPIYICWFNVVARMHLLSLIESCK